MTDHANTTRKGLAQARRAAPGIDPNGAPCYHPPARLFAWYARDDTAPGGQVLCVVCLECQTVLAGGATLADADGSGDHG